MKILDLLYGGETFIYSMLLMRVANPKMKNTNEWYYARCIGILALAPFPDSFQEIADDNAARVVEFIHSFGPPTRPYPRVTRREIQPADRDFILRIMKLDHRDRPTAEQLLNDEWFSEESEDTREPLPSNKEQVVDEAYTEIFMIPA